MIFLDTDHITVLQRRSELAYTILRTQLQSFPPEDVGTTIVTVQEQLRGWSAVIHQAKSLDHEVFAYQQLYGLLNFFASIPIALFDRSAAAGVTRLRAARLRVGAMDLRIAAIALAHDALLLSRNVRDFMRIPDLRVEDWTQARE
ncbi:MAG: type II toxin-antitoxin system VapC family toxin [Deltaproteobacteria bacterium]|nr:type II toxin-antitoxin system VapC family toxin [Deltaproteobacteria bacterium]